MSAAFCEQVMGFPIDDEMQKKWKAFVRKIDTKTDVYSRGRRHGNYGLLYCPKQQVEMIGEV